MMSTHKLLAGVAIAALLSTAPALAQDMKKGDAPSGGAGMGSSQNGPAAQPQHNETAPGSKSSTLGNRGTTGNEGTKGQAQRQEEPGKSPNRGATDHTQKGATEKGHTPKSNAENKAQPGQDHNKAAERPTQDQNKNAQTKGNDPDRNAATNRSTQDRKDVQQDKSATNQNGSRGNVQLSEQQRMDLHRDILKERNVNRTNVKVDIHVGARVPRNIRLAALPATIVSIVPAYRSYRYFVEGDEICIVDPASYEVVDVITSRGTVAQRSNNLNVGLTLSEQDRMIVLREVDLGASSSTMGLGAVTEGASVPRSVELLDMPVTVVDRIPKLQGYKYFVAEQRVAIVDPNGSKVQLVIDAHEK
jgi:hypothetical protein